MELTINEKTYELKFGIKFINTLDNMYKQELNGVEFGMGVEMALTYLAMYRPNALMNVIIAATSHSSKRPSKKEIENFLEDLASKNDGSYDSLFDEVQEAMRLAPFLKKIIKATEQANG